jgi:1-Cys peroxiredoxin 6
MPLNLGDTVPDFSCDSSVGQIHYYDYVGDEHWSIICSHPSDFTPVCSTELGNLAKLLPQFEKRHCKVLALSCDSAESHRKWIEDINASGYCGNTKKDGGVSYPILADEERALAVKFGMLDPAEKDERGMPLTCRAVFIVDDHKKLRATILYPATTGRNFYEILRVVDSLQLTDEYPVATPANWERGEKVAVTPSTPDEVAAVVLGDFAVVKVPSGKTYLRLAKDPSSKTPKVLKRGIVETILGTEYGAKLLPTVGRLIVSFILGGVFAGASTKTKETATAATQNGGRKKR